MRKIAGVLIERLGLIALAAAAATLLHYYSDLSFAASILLGCAFTIIGLWLYALKELAAFKPYRLIFGVNYDALWEDLKLTPAEGPKFENVSLTAINAAIFARSDQRAYSVKLDLYKDIPCGAPTWRTGPGEINDGPTFFLRPARDGYQFGAHVQREWWKAHSLQLDQALRDRQLAYDNTIVLRFLPYGFMHEHTRRWNETASLWYGFDRKQRRWKTRLQQEGWTFDDNYPTHINHRYLSIGYYDL
ncbi:hypothetical protein RBB79_17870 [Tunturiibacter empetritectus]|uniref:Uncharacterized protein n=1 Tax=Tunturiibacter lichenicola TaxID=2051959 RepID=A0A852VFB4_9BACT|nr:hypothetical protein [Edaphobacter lichenicola]NYF91513.1 hypothetical protein [Edaphobacter lichenicola]